MQTAKSGSHTIWDCKYHIVWVTKYCYPVLVGDVGLRARELLREISRSHEMMIHAGAINRDHVHLLMSAPPQLSVSRAVQYLKGKLAQASDGVSISEEAILGTAFVEQGLLGCVERKRHRRSVEE